MTATTAETITIRWPAAQDDRTVDLYRVFRDDVKVAELPASGRQFVLEDLHSSTDYLLGVAPVDDAGNVGERLSIVASTADGDPPVFPANAQLRVRDVSTGEDDSDAEAQLSFEWPAATDASGISHYRITHEGEVIASVDGDQNHYTYTPEGAAGDAMDGAYGVAAEDAAGNISLVVAARYPELQAPPIAGAQLPQPEVGLPTVPNLPEQPALRLTPNINRTLRPENLRRIRLLTSPAIHQGITPIGQPMNTTDENP